MNSPANYQPVIYGPRPHMGSVLCAGCCGWINGAVSYYVNNEGPFCSACHAREQEPALTSEAQKDSFARALAAILVRHGVVQQDAIEDPEYYDGYKAWNGISRSSDEFLQYLKERKCSL